MAENETEQSDRSRSSLPYSDTVQILTCRIQTSTSILQFQPTKQIP